MDTWDPGAALELVEGEAIAVMISTPVFMRTMIDHPRFATTDTKSLRLFSLGGAGVAPAMVREGAQAFGCWCKRTYGSTEYPTLTTGRLGDDPERDATTDGPLIGASELRIVDPETLADLAPGTAGELLVRGPEMFTGYLDAALDTDAFVDGGWFRTGDLAVYDGEYLTIVDRLKDIIIRGGENISAQEVEALLVTHADVAEAACVAVPGPGDGRAGVRVRDPARRRRARPRRPARPSRRRRARALQAAGTTRGAHRPPSHREREGAEGAAASRAVAAVGVPSCAARGRDHNGAVAKDARGEPEDDALDVIDLITDEPVPIGRRIEPPPDEEERRPPRKRRLILIAIAAAVVTIVGVSVVVTRDGDGTQGVGLASDDTGDADSRAGSGTTPRTTPPDVAPDVWRALGSRFGMAVDTEVLLVDGATGSVDTPRTLPDGLARVVSGHGGALFVVAGDRPVVLDAGGRRDRHR